MNNNESFNFVKNVAQTILEDKKSFVFCANNNESTITDVKERVEKYGWKIFYFNDKNKKGIEDGIAWLTDKFTK